MFPPKRDDVTASADVSRSLQGWLWVMLIAPFVPWYTFPIPIAVWFAVGLATFTTAATSGPPQPTVRLLASGLMPVLGVLWIFAAFLVFFSARRRLWRRALWVGLMNFGCGVTLLATFLLGTGIGPVEPLGYVSPLAFLPLSAFPAAYEIAGRWLRELNIRSGSEAERMARFRLLVVGVGYAVAFTTVVAVIAVATAAAIQRLPTPHFYHEEQEIRESAAVTFAILGTASLSVFLALSRFLLSPRTPRP